MEHQELHEQDDDVYGGDMPEEASMEKIRKYTKMRCHAHTTTALRGKNFFINSLILAARSRFFRKLFSNGMLGCGQKLVTLRIGTSGQHIQLCIKYMVWEALALLLIGISINQLKSFPEGTAALGLPVTTVSNLWIVGSINIVI
ncbi:hypothetical protein ACS0TY_024052 [Phlomoides rotata]